MQLDDSILKKYCEDVGKKHVPAVNEPEVVTEFLKYIQLQSEIMSCSSAYEISSNMRSFGFWYDNRNTNPLMNIFKHRDVFYVDLGAYNIKYEEGFMHPCLVVRNYGSSVVVIPGSTKKYGIKNNLIFDVVAGDGFTENTGLMLDQIRCVSTTRLQGKLGRVLPATYDNIMNRFMEKFLCKQFGEFNQIKAKYDKIEKQMNKSKEEIEKYKAEIEKHKEEIEKLKEENNLLKKQVV